jgi:hypothetical protein
MGMDVLEGYEVGSDLLCNFQLVGTFSPEE